MNVIAKNNSATKPTINRNKGLIKFKVHKPGQNQD